MPLLVMCWCLSRLTRHCSFDRWTCLLVSECYRFVWRCRLFDKYIYIYIYMCVCMYKFVSRTDLNNANVLCNFVTRYNLELYSFFSGVGYGIFLFYRIQSTFSKKVDFWFKFYWILFKCSDSFVYRSSRFRFHNEDTIYHSRDILRLNHKIRACSDI